MLPLVRSISYSTESINEVCTSTASLSVSGYPNHAREYHDSPTIVSQSSLSCAPSDQFEDAPEDEIHTILPPKSSTNPLDALAIACAAKNTDTIQKTEKVETVIEQSQSSSFQQSQTPSFEISQNDVLCGRGGLTNHHPGNVFFRRLVRMKQESYLMASKREKAGVAKEIVESIRNLSPKGRFLKKDPQNPGHWIEIGDRKAREKTSQALREGAPELREGLQSTEQKESTKSKQKIGSNYSAFEKLKHGEAVTPAESPASFKPSVARLVSSDSITYSPRHHHHAPYLEHPYSERMMSTSHVIIDDQPFQRLPYNSSVQYHRPPYYIEQNSSQQQQPCALIGNKRKLIDSGINYSDGSVCHNINENVIARGPRLKLLKQRLRGGMFP